MEIYPLPVAEFGYGPKTTIEFELNWRRFAAGSLTVNTTPQQENP